MGINIGSFDDTYRSTSAIVLWLLFFFVVSCLGYSVSMFCSKRVYLAKFSPSNKLTLVGAMCRSK